MYTITLVNHHHNFRLILKINDESQLFLQITLPKLTKVTIPAIMVPAFRGTKPKQQVSTCRSLETSPAECASVFVQNKDAAGTDVFFEDATNDEYEYINYGRGRSVLLASVQLS
ncbi:hypothetical protein V9T40_010612 [Parthenolecanium corni]|uniref:Uncharacterized protein n=1 Tax=Parthenolecanium corni TaxID=536013 RepID=A0AAN9TIC0_9HEMI